eukprot:g5064.t1
MNFAAAAKRETGPKDLKVIQLSGLVLVKLQKHCNESLPTLVTGQLLGLDVGSTLEVTDCFPFPNITPDDENGAPESASYQLEMMKCLREVNVDNNTVGWYQSTNFGSFETIELLDTFVNYHESIQRCVCIIYDPQSAKIGQVGLRAIRLQDSFIKLYKSVEQLTGEKLRASGLSWSSIFSEIPICIQNSSLVKGVMLGLDKSTSMKKNDVNRLDLNLTSFLDQSLCFLGECVDDLMQEQKKMSQFNKSVVKQQQQYQQWLQARRIENTARRAAGEDPLPEEDPNLFKALQEPSPIDSCLITHQMKTYSDQVAEFASLNLEKLHLAQTLQNHKTA